MPFVSKFRFELSDEERSAQLDEGVRVAEELVRLASRDREDTRDTPRTILARMEWDAYLWTRDNREPDSEALTKLDVYFPQHLFNTLRAQLMAENPGLGTLVASLIDTFKRDALDRAKGARLSAASRSLIREATIAFGNGLDSVWESLATPEARAAAQSLWIPANVATKRSGLNADTILKRAKREGWPVEKIGRMNAYRLTDLELAWPKRNFRTDK